MSLMKSLNSGISGLRAFQTRMDVIGNNISNVDTIGFKSSRVTFSEMLSQQVGTGQGSASSPQSGSQVGLGVRISAIQRDFNQGGLQTTGRSTDLAVEGNGFFMVKEGAQTFLTRAGNFSFNREGFLVDQSGRNVQGFNATATGGIISGSTTDNIRIDFQNVLSPRATSQVFMAGNMSANTSLSQVLTTQSSFTTRTGGVALQTTPLNQLSQVSIDMVAGDQLEFEVRLNDGTLQTVSHTFADGDTLGNLMNTLNTQLDGEAVVSLVDGAFVMRSVQLGNSELGVVNISVNGSGAAAFPTFLTTQAGVTGTKSASTTVFDSLGRPHTLIITLEQTAANTWSYEAGFVDGEEVINGASGVMEFDETGNLITNSNFALEFDPGDGASIQSFQINLGDPSNGSRISQFAGSDSVKVISQDGFTEGSLIDFNIDRDGFVNGVFSNGRNVRLAQVALGGIRNVDGLETTGNGLFRTTIASGDIDVSSAQNLQATSIASGVLEGSNVDLAREFTNMITSQRAFQSNARVITTADEFLAEAVSLKR